MMFRFRTAILGFEENLINHRENWKNDFILVEINFKVEIFDILLSRVTFTIFKFPRVSHN